MLRDKIKKTKNAIIETKALLIKENQKNRDHEFAELVEKEIPSLRKTIHAIRNVEKAFPQQWLIPNMAETANLTKQLVENMKHQPKERIGPILTSIKSLDKEARRQWIGIVKQHHQETRKTLLLMKKIQKDSTKYEQFILQLDRFETIWPISQESLNLYVSTLQQAKETITSSKLSASVQGLLEKMAEGKATLNELNEEVLTWINAQNLSSHIYMSFK